MFVKNEGKTDRIVRVALGLILLSLIFIGPKTLWGLVGLIPLVTGLIGFCPCYKMCGFNTCSLKQLENCVDKSANDQ